MAGLLKRTLHPGKFRTQVYSMKVLFRNVVGLALLTLPLYAAAQPPAQQTTQPAAQPPASAPVMPGPTATAGSTAGPSTPVGVTSTVAPGASPQSSPAYIIGPDDSLQIVVWQDAKLSGVLPVRPDGMISVALIGDVAAAGKTPMDLAKDLTERLKQYITDPTVSVTVMAVNSKRIFMIGEVTHVGPVPLTLEMTPLQAIASAGGLTPYANKGKIYILRLVNGKQTKIRFDYKKALLGDDLGPKLLSGDTIVVP